MVYSYVINTAKNTPISNPKIVRLPLELGVVEDLIIDFPPGSAHLLNLIMYYHGAKHFPKGTGYFSGNGTILAFRRLGYSMETFPTELLAITWNESTRYAHKVYIYINIVKSGFSFI